MKRLRTWINANPADAFGMVFFVGAFLLVLSLVLRPVLYPPIETWTYDVSGLRLCHPTQPNRCVTLPPGTKLILPLVGRAKVYPTAFLARY
jgi:hypothetical protein